MILQKSLKLKAYLKIDSLQEYVLIEQDIAEIEVIRRKNHWQSERFYLGDSVHFDAINLTIDVSEIYDRVDNDDMLKFLSDISEKEANSDSKLES